MVEKMNQINQEYSAATTVCPFCEKPEKRLVTLFEEKIDQPLLEKIKADRPDWHPGMGVCTGCLDDAHQSLLQNLLDVEMTGSTGFSVLPTPIRMNAHPGYNGKGVTICLIDSGFHIHPDLEFPKNRIKKVKDITKPKCSGNYFRQPNANAWHGTMTSVVCAGNGHLSGGLYRGIASEAELVLLKVTDDEGRITGDNIVKALHWVIRNHDKYGLSLIHISEPTRPY